MNWEFLPERKQDSWGAECWVLWLLKFTSVSGFNTLVETQDYDWKPQDYAWKTHNFNVFKKKKYPLSKLISDFKCCRKKQNGHKVLPFLYTVLFQTSATFCILVQMSYIKQIWSARCNLNTSSQHATLIWSIFLYNFNSEIPCN